ncbi:hypothetical protein [Methanoregula sp.]|uniref:zinc ribbon domain-containing protein n=1 Tax=Methanoregula sp. TaxID=2052170 RepID=UPI0035698B2F
MICPNCGKNTPEGKFCEFCGASLQAVPVPVSPPPSPSIPASQPASVPAVKKEKNVIISAITSAIWPGLGQAYNGRGGFGVFLWSCFYLVYLLYTIASPQFYLMAMSADIPSFKNLIHSLAQPEVYLLILIAIWCYAVYDAYRLAKKMNTGEVAFVDLNPMQIVIFIVGSIIMSIIIGSFVTF